jgi:bisphosphoglycerate-independent phosphoglycerate mutase (AlkP superfamily)
MLRNLDRPISDCDAELTDFALRWLLLHDFDFAFIYLGKTDVVGHSSGWMSQSYLAAINQADSCIGRVQEALSPGTTYVIMADHGGHAQTHGTDRDDDMTIPLLIKGPDIPKGKEMGAGVSILDIAPTLLTLFGLKKPKEWVGKGLLDDDKEKC